jgi:hypothetical protein
MLLLTLNFCGIWGMETEKIQKEERQIVGGALVAYQKGIYLICIT